VRYRKRLDTKFGDLLRLHSFSVVAVGFERLVSEAEPRLVSDDFASRGHAVTGS